MTWTEVKMKNTGQNMSDWIYILENINGIEKVKFKIIQEGQYGEINEYIVFSIYYDDTRLSFKLSKIINKLLNIHEQ